MIFDSLEFADVYKLGTNFEKAFEFLQGLTADTANGRYDVDGERIFAMVTSYDTKPIDAAELEVHRRYIDVQMTLIGEETIGHCNLSNELVVTKEYDEEADITFFRQPSMALNYVCMAPGLFAIFFPHDVHLPGIVVNGLCTVKKAVVKIAV